MPPRRSTGRNASTRSQQATLSFGAKSRITKPSTSTAQGKKTKDVEQIPSAIVSETPLDTSLPEQAPVAPPATSSKPHVAEVVVQNQAEEELEKPQTAEDRKALKVPEAELKRYWNAEERKRKAPRVHQGDLDLKEKILRHFDLSSQYGPCIGISRIKRWRRAHDLDLNPPIEVLAVLLKGQKTPVKERAYIDELLS